MKLTNQKIYELAILINKAQEENNLENDFIDFNLPININFYIQQNFELILNAAILIEKSRNFIIQKYKDSKSENNSDKILIKKEYILEAQKELQDLMNIEQDLNIKIIKLSQFDNINISSSQLRMIMFMIEDDISDLE